MSTKLTVAIPSDREVVITRVFDAPRRLVFDAYTKPDLVRRWLLGPPGWTMPVCNIDLRVGGKYRYEWRGPEGENMAVSGVFREITPVSRLVNTEIFDEDWTGGETIATLDLTEAGGKTTIRQTVLYASKTARDGALKTGMTEGMEMGYQLLETLLAQLA